jgi:hypothetical protein
VLQPILSYPVDGFVRVSRPAAGDQVSALANRLIATMPALGLGEYRKLAGADAARALELAKQQADARTIAEVCSCSRQLLHRQIACQPAGQVQAARWQTVGRRAGLDQLEGDAEQGPAFTMGTAGGVSSSGGQGRNGRCRTDRPRLARRN